MFEYLDDMEFLMKLDKANLRTQYARIVLLSFDEKPLKEIQGNITTGNLSVNGSSKVRRTLNLTMLANPENSELEDYDNEISINKKVRIFVGYKNPYKKYAHYGDIIWFPCGLFILTNASVSRGTSGWTISITAKDKMCLLDGTVGGTLPASTTFHKAEIQKKNGDIETVYPTIFQIVYEAVNHWGGEPVENIIISDLDETCRMLVRYKGDAPIYFDDNYTSFDFQYSDDFRLQYISGDDAGYEETPFTYPEELILNAGDTVATLLDKIVETLGNYEYFYDVWGRFVFLQIKNYLNTGSPLTELEEENYVKTYDNAKYLYSLTDLDTTAAINVQPNYSNLKNDFYVWGKKKTSSDLEIDIRYHLAIDTKPHADFAMKYMWLIYEPETEEKDELWLRYVFTNTDSEPDGGGYSVRKVCSPCNEYEWREELYRRALVAQVENSIFNDYQQGDEPNGVALSCYDSEMIAEWRDIYDPDREEWQFTVMTIVDADGERKQRQKPGWNPDVFNHPENLKFWIDFIDTGSALGKYSINQIGRRTKVINSLDIKSIYNKEVPDIIFLKEYTQEQIEHYTTMGLKYFILTDKYFDMFSISTTGVSCFDKIREMMYQNLSYNTTILLTCLPKYYMEPNNIIHIEDAQSNINGNYLVTQFTLPLAYNGTMSITASEVLTRV